MAILDEARSQGKPATLCCWCDSLADSEPVRYAGVDHPTCIAHSKRYRAPITYSNEDFDRTFSIVPKGDAS